METSGAFLIGGAMKKDIKSDDELLGMEGISKETLDNLSNNKGGGEDYDLD